MHDMFVREKEGAQLNIKSPVFKKKMCSYLYNNFGLVFVVVILNPSLNESKIRQISLGSFPQTPQKLFGTNHFFCVHLALLGFSAIFNDIFIIIDQ